MQPREPGTAPLGQLLVDRGVLTSTQLYQISLEQRVTGKPLGEIIMERGLASPDALKNASDGSAYAPIDSDLDSEVHPQVPDERALPDEMPRGLRERAARRLDNYLAATAAELDERGETLEQRSRALEEKAEQLTAAESQLERRARRLRDLDIEDANASNRIDHLLKVVAGREAQIEEIGRERDRALKELGQAGEQIAAREAEAAQRGQLLSEKDEQAAALVGELEAARAELDSASNELERTVARSEATLAVAQDQLRDLQTENAGLKASCREAEALLLELQRNQTNQAAELAHAHQLLDERSHRTSELQRALADARATLVVTQQELRELHARTPEQALSEPTHLLHVPGTGCYALVERPGPPPDVGERIAQDKDGEGRFVVTRVGASPLPDDERTCAYLQPE